MKESESQRDDPSRDEPPRNSHQKMPANKISLGRLVVSVLAAAIGVQSDKNRRQDFTSSSILPFIIAGVVFTALFVFILIAVVSTVVD